ncbi:hypothetical protein [Bacillus sp. 03113]|uniref:hypothetical protein n=1 Tax=Bacillus sp. 03113 TaxID=2578211 RepID=UPI0015E88516|nr:hypothetical protein [Bacillus sp. 03113]
MIIGFILIFFYSYLGLVDHSLEAFISYALFNLSIFFLADLVYRRGRYFYITSFIGVLMLLANLYFTFIYPYTIVDDKYEFVEKKVKVEEKEAVSMDEQHIAIVPEKYARYRSEKKLGELAQSSYYDLGDSTIQKIDNHLYWVTPIEYTGFFKWKRADSVPGYIKMSAEDENEDAQLVKTKMKYVPSAFFHEDLKRHVRKEHKNAILLEASFEPNDQGEPYYVVPYGYYNKFRQIIDIKGIYLINPENGKIEDFKMNQIPAFVDHVIPTNVAEDWNEWYGKYVHGYWNTIFSKEDIKLPTEWDGIDEVNGIFNKDLNMNWFTDFTRPKSGSGSMVGYSLMNARTGDMTFFTGANGSLNGKAAMNVAEKTYRANKYEAGTPLLYMIYGQFTWVVPLMDSNDVLREIMLVNAKDEKVFSANAQKNKLFTNYQYAIATQLKGDKTVPTDLANLKTIEGTVEHVYKAEQDNNTVVKFMIKGNKKIFQVSSADFPYAIFIESGANVTVNYIDTNEIVSTVEQFEMSGF